MKFNALVVLFLFFSTLARAEIGSIVVTAYIFSDNSIELGNTIGYDDSRTPSSRLIHVNVLSEQEFGPFKLQKISFVVQSKAELDFIANGFGFRDIHKQDMRIGNGIKFFRLENVRTIGYGNWQLNRKPYSVDPEQQAKDIYTDYLFAEIERLKEIRRKRILLSNLEKWTLEVRQMAACQALFL